MRKHSAGSEGMLESVKRGSKRRGKKSCANGGCVGMLLSGFEK